MAEKAAKPAESPDPTTNPFYPDPAPAPEVPERPRNPDGTFAKQAPDEPSAPPAPTHPSYLIEAAKEVGFTDNEITSTPSEQLNAQVYRIQKAARIASEQARDQLARLRHEPQVAEKVAPAPPPEPDDDLIFSQLEEEGYDKRLIGSIRKALKLSKQVEPLKSEIGEVTKRDQVRSVTSNTEKIEAAFEALGPTFHKYFGDVAASEMPKDAIEIRRRRMILSEAGIDFTRDSVQAIKKKIKTAAEIAYGPVAAKPADPYAGVVPKNGQAKSGKTYTEEEWQAAALAQPTSRVAEELPPGEERAIKNLAKKLGVTADTSRFENLEKL